MIKHLILLRIQTTIDINRVLLQWLKNFFDNKSVSFSQPTSDLATQELAEELHKPIIRKFEKRKVYLSLIDNS